MSLLASLAELKNEKKAKRAALLFLLLFIILLLLPLMSYQNPPPGQEGIMVNLGIPDVGDGDQNAPPPASTNQGEEITPPEETEVEEVEEEEEEEEVQPEEKVEVEPEKKPDPKPDPVKEVVKTEDPAAIALKKKKEAAAKAAKEAKTAEDAKKKADDAKKKAVAAAKAKADAEAKAKADAAAKFNDAKNKYSGAFGGDNGKGKGETGTAGNQGDPNGDPNADALTGISTGSGKVGGGLGGRGIVSSPKVSDNTQKTGTIVLKVCVGADGRVVGTPEYTQRGSTSSDSQLRATAIRNAKKWRFSPGAVDKQCGSITYEFKVK